MASKNEVSKRRKSSRSRRPPRKILEESSSDDVLTVPVAIPVAPKPQKKRKRGKGKKTALQTIEEMEADRKEKMLVEIEKLDANQIKNLLVEACLKNEALKQECLKVVAGEDVSVEESGGGDDHAPGGDNIPDPLPPLTPKWCLCHRCTEMPVVRHNVCCMVVPCRAYTEVC